jgi:hypothetical protein
MNIIITESQALKIQKILSESPIDDISVKKTTDGSIVFNDKLRYNLEVKKLGMWNEVDIVNITKVGGTYKITAKFGTITQSDYLDNNAMEDIIQNMGKPVIEFETEELPKRLVRVPLGNIAGL